MNSYTAASASTASSLPCSGEYDLAAALGHRREEQNLSESRQQVTWPRAKWFIKIGMRK